MLIEGQIRGLSISRISIAHEAVNLDVVVTSSRLGRHYVAGLRSVRISRQRLTTTRTNTPVAILNWPITNIDLDAAHRIHDVDMLGIVVRMTNDPRAIRDAMAGQRHNDDPRAGLEPATGPAANNVITSDSMTPPEPSHSSPRTARSTTRSQSSRSGITRRSRSNPTDLANTATPAEHTNPITFGIETPFLKTSS